MQFKNTNFSNDFGNKKKEYMFDKICTEFNSFKGKALGRGSYGSAYKLQNFNEFFPNTKNIVVKEIDTGATSRCQEKATKDEYNRKLLIGKKKGDPKEVEAFYCYGDNIVLAEYYISLEASLLNSENFVDTYIYKDCTKKGKQYIFMEEIDTTFRKYFETVYANSNRDLDKQKKFDAVLIQILHALWCLHEAGINHNDSKADNIFLKKADGYITKDGYKLQDFDYVGYDFGAGGFVYIPVKDIEYVVKVGDFGLSLKYSEPLVLTDTLDQEFTVDYLSPFYDIMLTFSEINSNASPLYKTIQSYILGFDGSIDFVNDNFDREKINNEWPGIQCNCANTCRLVKKTDDIIKNSTNQELENFLKNEYQSFVNCIFWNKEKADVDRRQIYNFRLSKMKDSEINVNKIVSLGFFKDQIREYGWDEIDSSSILPFGGAGKYPYRRKILKDNSEDSSSGEATGGSSSSDESDESSDDSEFDTDIEEDSRSSGGGMFKYSP